MKTVAIIQARMGSTRLPGKVMLSLDCTPVIRHVIRRTMSADAVDETVVATTEKERDTIICRCGSQEGSKLFRGDEDDVLDRMHRAASEYGADYVVRITADNPLLSAKIIDSAIKKLDQSEADYVSNKIDRTFPSGLDIEVFTFDSLTRIESQIRDPYYREHVTPYYRESDEFNRLNINSRTIFDECFMLDRTDIRLTLDNSDDYELFKKIYENVPYNSTIDIHDAIKYIDENDLQQINIK